MQIEVTRKEAMLLRHLLDAACKAYLNTSRRGMLDMSNMGSVDPWSLRKQIAELITNNPTQFEKALMAEMEKE